ncbi:GntR family transcriptional regulator [bacterium]|nr:GntR family transcriptional regulator [bacterium]
MSQKGSKITIFQAEVERTTSLLCKEIYAGNKLPHEHLIEAKLAEAYKVSRMVIRQTLARLESFGMVQIEPYKGATVAPITIERIRSEYEIVGMMEGYATKLATKNMTAVDIQKLEEIQAEHRLVTDDDVHKWHERNKQFHGAINRRCGNKKLMKLIAQHIKFTNYWFLSFRGFYQNLDTHEEILQAIKGGDGESARKLMENHIVSACDIVIENIQTNIPIGAFRVG